MRGFADGRQVLAGLALMRSAFYRLDDYKLETAAGVRARVAELIQAPASRRRWRCVPRSPESSVDRRRPPILGHCLEETGGERPVNCASDVRSEPSGYVRYSALRQFRQLIRAIRFRRLASESEEFQVHSSDLAVRDGRLHRCVGEDHFISLEKEMPRPGKPSESILGDFMAYLNPGSDGVEEAEVETAARLMDARGGDPGKQLTSGSHHNATN